MAKEHGLSYSYGLHLKTFYLIRTHQLLKINYSVKLLYYQKAQARVSKSRNYNEWEIYKASKCRVVAWTPQFSAKNNFTHVDLLTGTYNCDAP